MISTPFLRSVLAILTTTAILMILWLAVSTRLFFDPTEVEIDGYTVTVSRSFPLSNHFRIPVIRYIETVRPIDGPLPPCVDTAEFRYRDNGEPFGQWSIEPWAARCMTGSYIWRATWSARLFGVIPLRPVELEELVVRGADLKP